MAHIETTYPAVPDQLPPELQEAIALLPPNLDRRTAVAELYRHTGIRLSHRTLEAWPLPARRVLGRSLIPTAALFRLAYAKLAAAPMVMGGRKTTIHEPKVAP